MKLFYQIKVYDYDTKQEAEEHMKEMIADGWNVKKQEGELILFLGEDFDNLYEVEYYKEAK